MLCEYCNSFPNSQSSDVTVKPACTNICQTSVNVMALMGEHMGLHIIFEIKTSNVKMISDYRRSDSKIVTKITKYAPLNGQS